MSKNQPPHEIHRDFWKLNFKNHSKIILEKHLCVCTSKAANPNYLAGRLKTKSAVIKLNCLC